MLEGAHTFIEEKIAALSVLKMAEFHTILMLMKDMMKRYTGSFLDHPKKIGAFDQILVIEEPLEKEIKCTLMISE